MTNNTLNAGTREEVFLPQPQFLTSIIRVIRIQNLSDLINPFALLQGKMRPGINWGLSRPQPQIIDNTIVIPNHRHIIRHGQDIIGIMINHPQMAAATRPQLNPATKLYGDGAVFLTGLPRKTIAHPVIRQFDLIAIHKRLLKQAILIANTIPVAGHTNTGHGIHKRRSQPAKPAVT